MDTNKFGQVLLLSTLPTYPKSLDIFDLKYGSEIPYLPAVWTYEYERQGPAPRAFFGQNRN